MRFYRGSNILEPQLHNFAKNFLFQVDKMMIHPNSFTIIKHCFHHYIYKRHNLALILMKNYEIHLYIE
jgi:hypothetical protein